MARALLIVLDSVGIGGAPDAARYGDMAGASGFDLSRMTGDRLCAVLHGLALEEEVAEA